MARPDFVALEGGRLTLNGAGFTHVGMNLPGLAYYGLPGVPAGSQSDQDFNMDAWRRMGVKVLRIFGANRSLTHAQAADRVVDLADRAYGLYGLRLLVSLTDLYNNYHHPQGDDGAYQLDPNGFSILSLNWFSGGFRGAYLTFVRTVVGRLKDHPGIMGWELGNELKSVTWGSPHALIDPFTIETAAAIRAIDPDHLLTIGLEHYRAAGLTETQAVQLYLPLDIVQVHRYNGETFSHDLDIARPMGKAHIVGEAGFTANCGSGGRGSALQGDLFNWFDSLGTDGYYQWGAQAQCVDIADGDNVFGFDRYCHTDFDDLYAIYAQRALGFPVAPPPCGGPADLQVQVSGPSAIQPGQTATFSASASGGAPPYSYEWTFGDGSSAAGQQASHIYASIGVFIVAVTVRDVVGDSASASKSIEVTTTPPPGQVTTPIVLLIGLVGAAAGLGYLLAQLGGQEEGGTQVVEIEEGEPVPPGWRVVG
jgi:hypothetical protein